MSVCHILKKELSYADLVRKEKIIQSVSKTVLLFLWKNIFFQDSDEYILFYFFIYFIPLQSLLIK